jgi:hypothetical protein
MDPNETRAVARLPHLDIELHHRRSSEEGYEMLSVTLRGRPDLDAAAALLDPFRLLTAWAAFNPWLAPWRPLFERPPSPLLADRTDEPEPR